jgi:hypothetical protein
MATGRKTGGRKQGTPNSERKDLVEMLRDKYPNYNPVIALADIAHSSKNELLRFQAHKEVAKYISPQLKSIEINGDLDTNNMKPIIIDWSDEKIKYISKELEDKY